MQPALRSTRRRTVIGLLVTFLILGLAVAIVAVPSWILHGRLDRAQTAIRARQYHEAMEWLNKAAKLGEHHPQVQLLLARTERHLENLDAAAVHLGLAQENGLANQLVDLEWKLTQAQAGRLQEVTPYIGPMIVTAGDDKLEVYEAVVRGFLAQRYFTQAENMLNTWNQETSGDALAYMYRGHVYAAQYAWPQALNAYGTALKYDPDNLAANYGFGRAHFETERFVDAEKYFRKCLQLAPTHLGATALLARCLLKRDAVAEARTVLEQGAKTNPLDDQIRLGLSAVAFAEKDYDGALEHLQTMLKDWPEDEQACQLQAQILEALGRSDEAAEAQDKARRAHEQLIAIPELLKVAKEHPSAATHYEVGLVLLQHGWRPDGRDWIEASLLIHPTNREARQMLISYFEKIGNREQVALHRRLLDVRPQ